MAVGLGTCATQLEGIGTGGCTPEGLLKFANGFIPALESQQFDTFADYNDETKNKEAIAALELFPIGFAEEAENTSSEELTSETSAGNIIFHRNGRYKFTQSRLLTPDQHRILYSYDQKIKAGYLVDNLGTRLGTTPDGTIVKPLTVSYFKVKPLDLPFASDGSSWSMIEVEFKFIDEVNKQPAYSNASDLDWSPEIVFSNPLTKIAITPSSVAAFAFTAAFAYVDPTTGGSVPVTGLSANGAELTILDQTASALTNVTVVATATEGTYTITDGDSGLTSGSITMDASAANLYYSDLTVLSA